MTYGHMIEIVNYVTNTILLYSYAFDYNAIWFKNIKNVTKKQWLKLCWVMLGHPYKFNSKFNLSVV